MTLPAVRAAARIAWRQARRVPGRSALIVAMIAMPIAALTFGATLIRTSVPTLEEHVTREMGSAELKLGSPTDADVASLEASLPQGSRVVTIKQWNRSLVVDGSMVYASASEPSIPIDQPPLPGLYELMDGRAPKTPGEAAVDPRVLEIFDVRIGQDLTIGERTFHVVGVAARPSQMWDPYLVVAPGTLGAATPEDEGELFFNSILVDLPPGPDLDGARSTVLGWLRRSAKTPEEAAQFDQAHAESSGMIQTRDGASFYFINDALTLTGASFGAAVLVLFATGLISAAAFAVGIRRQLRMLGLVGATGGEPAHVRAVVLLSGTCLGIVGAGLGVIAGVGAAYLAVPQLPRITHALPGAVLLHWPTIAGAALLGVVAATVAAAWPARLAARVSTLDSLAARMPTPRPAGRLARWGLAGVVAGAALTAATARPGRNEAVLAAGLSLTLCGFLVTIPLLVHVSGRYAPRLPTAPRLAIRETARNGRRTGTAIAAAALALTLPVTVAALSLSEEAFQRRTPWMGDEHLLVGTFNEKSGVPDAPPPDLLAEIRRLLPGAIVTSPRPAMVDLERHPPPPGFEEVEEFPAYVEGPLITFEGAAAGESYRQAAQLFIGDPELLRALNAEDGIPALEAGKIVAIGPDGTDEGFVYLRTPSLVFDPNLPPGSQPTGVKLPAVEAGRVQYVLEDRLPRYVVSLEAAAELGLVPGAATRGPSMGETLVAARSPLTPEQIAAVKQAAARVPDSFIRTIEDFVPRFGPARLAATGAAAFIALGIVAVIVALVAAEGRRDQAILVAIGAEPRTRRRIAGARSGLVTLFAGMIAVPAGFVPIAVIQWARRFPIVVPWITLAFVAVAVPLVAALFGWLSSRAPKSSAMLQPVP